MELYGSTASGTYAGTLYAPLRRPRSFGIAGDGFVCNARTRTTRDRRYFAYRGFGRDIVGKRTGSFRKTRTRERMNAFGKAINEGCAVLHGLFCLFVGFLSDFFDDAGFGVSAHQWYPFV